MLTEMAMWMTCTVMDELYCHGCTGLSVQWRQRRQLGGGKKFFLRSKLIVHLAVEWMGHNVFRVTLI